jgi:hypothetical protein
VEFLKHNWYEYKSEEYDLIYSYTIPGHAVSIPSYNTSLNEKVL